MLFSSPFEFICPPHQMCVSTFSFQLKMCFIVTYVHKSHSLLALPLSSHTNQQTLQSIVVLPICFSPAIQLLITMSLEQLAVNKLNTTRLASGMLNITYLLMLVVTSPSFKQIFCGHSNCEKGVRIINYLLIAKYGRKEQGDSHSKQKVTRLGL